MPKPRDHVATAALDGLVYAAGGRAQDQQSVRTFERYDPRTDRWKRRAELPEPKASFALLATPTSVVTAGGEDLRQLDRTAGSGRGAIHITGASWAYAEGPWRDRSGSQLVLPFNQGLLGTRLVRDAIVAGDGRSRPLRERLERTLVFDVLGEDLPLPERRIELSRRRDRLGLPRTRIHHPGDSAYLQTARSRSVADLERRFGRYGARVVAVERAGEGSHRLGTCFMGERAGVVDADLRQHRYENLFVAEGSFPSYSAHHPTLTICALAPRLGRHLLSSS